MACGAVGGDECGQRMGGKKTRRDGVWCGDAEAGRRDETASRRAMACGAVMRWEAVSRGESALAHFDWYPMVV